MNAKGQSMTDTEKLLSLVTKGKQKALADFLNARKRGDKMTMTDLRLVRALEDELRDQEEQVEGIDDIFLSSKQVCSLYGVTKETLRLWVKGKEFPQFGRNKYPLKQSFEWWKNQYAGTEEDSSLAEEKRLKLVAERKLKELELLLQEGRLMFREEVTNEFVRRIHVLKSDLLNIPKQMKPGEAKTFVEKRIRNLLENYSRPSGVLKDGKS